MSDIDRTRPGRKRFIIYGLLFTMTLINYFDRTVLSIAMPVLIHEFTLTPVAVGYLLSAFIWSYAPCQLPAGMILDRWGTRKTASRCIAFWSAATALTGAANSFTARVLHPAVAGHRRIANFPACGTGDPRMGAGA